jgi:hypothetical protein
VGLYSGARDIGAGAEGVAPPSPRGRNLRQLADQRDPGLLRMPHPRVSAGGLPTPMMAGPGRRRLLQGPPWSIALLDLPFAALVGQMAGPRSKNL